MKFKVGDRVRVKKDSGWYTDKFNQGRILTILGINKGHKTEGKYKSDKGSSSGTWVNFGKRAFPLEWIEHVRIKNTKIARKLNPTWEVKGEWLVCAK